MKLGVSLPVFTDDPAKPLTVAVRAKELGLDGVFAPDHLFPPVFYPPSGPDRPALEVFSVLSAVTALAPGLRVGTLVTRVSLRAPGILAKQAAALDAMSHAGAILGIGTGDRASAEEHERFGFPYPSAAERLGRLEETARALHALFGGQTWPGGKFVPAMRGPLLPPGEPAIWVGGLSDAVLEVAARVADAWNGWGLDLEGFSARAARLRDLAGGRHVSPTWAGIALVGEDRADLDRLLGERAKRNLPLDGVWSGTADEWSRFTEALRAEGATWCVVLPAGPPDRLDVIAAATPR
ncbi:MAG TPA: LLM class flavin-dependent oxidoreductase [Actinomycetota bacterium]|nr:LLM class flavin-dependent oxidoreductase [Actinomycetota bacterium]